MNKIKKLLKMSGYSDEAIRFYLQKLNVGNMENPSVSEAYTGPCGDTMEIYLQIESEVIVDAKFQAVGGAGVFTSGSALMEMLKGKTLDEAEKIGEEDIIRYLGGIPETKFHCTCLAKKALKRTIEKYVMNMVVHNRA